MSDKPQKVSIKSNLPPRVSTNDIISLGGLELGYDVKNDIHYVHKDIELGPKETTVFDVEIRDIWVVPQDDLERLRSHAVELAAKLKGPAYEEIAAGLRSEVEKDVASIVERQAMNAISSGVKPMEHIRAYEANVDALKRARRSVGRMENLVLASGQDPGVLAGDDENASPPNRDLDRDAEEYRVAVIRITVQNTSPDKPWKDSIRRDLPPEVRLQDVVDAGGLEVARDFKSGACYVWKQEVEVPASQTVTFQVKIRDRWNVNGPRVRRMSATATNLMARISSRETYRSVEDALTAIMRDLASIASEAGPTVVNEQYVAFYRSQAARLDLVEQKLNRIRAALVPIEKTTRWGFRPKPPSAKTTWLIIYIILGFLGVFSLLFFARWYGKGKGKGE